MQKGSSYYGILPKVVPADKKTEVCIRSIDINHTFNTEDEFRITYYPTEEFAQRSNWPQDKTIQLKASGGVIRVELYFESEQEHVILLERRDGEDYRMVREFRVYSVKEDLQSRRPFKGDFHLHSHYSDGRESPAYVAARCRQIGLDFMAVTDHGQYAPSLEAISIFNEVDLALSIYSGEEVHPPDNPVHIINFDGRYSLNESFRENRSAYNNEVHHIQKGLKNIPPGVDPYQYASCVWCFEKIRNGGGLGIFCHPYWFTQYRYTPAGALTSYMFERQPFDVFELLGGFHMNEVDSNTLQVARYHEERARGREIPIVGASDAHGCEGDLFGWYYTLVWAESADKIKDAVKKLYSVAVEALPGETVRAYGPFRLVKYALFLLREILPAHDALCYEEGRLMLDYISGKKEAADTLAKLKKRNDEYYTECGF